MESGKFEEELRRISAISDHLSPNSMVLFNESFQSTNEREGSEIGYQIIRALLESRVKMFCVTHMYALASSFSDQSERNAKFLRAERQEDGTRTFRIIPGEPLRTSYGRDLFERIFGTLVTEPPGLAEPAEDCVSGQLIATGLKAPGTSASGFGDRRVDSIEVTRLMV
jgi:DNA mismatch repair ATPase MutS